MYTASLRTAAKKNRRISACTNLFISSHPYRH